MTRWDVTVNGSGLQGGGTDFQAAVERIAYAHGRGDRWDVMVKGPRDSALRLLNEKEAAKIVAAVTKEVS